MKKSLKDIRIVYLYINLPFWIYVFVVSLVLLAFSVGTVLSFHYLHNTDSYWKDIGWYLLLGVLGGIGEVIYGIYKSIKKENQELIANSESPAQSNSLVRVSGLELSVLLGTLVFAGVVAYGAHYVIIDQEQREYEEEQQRIADGENHRTVLKELKLIARAIDRQYGEKGELPNRVNDLELRSDVPLQDPWGKEYVIARVQGDLIIVCYGRDGKSGGEDYDSDYFLGPDRNINRGEFDGKQIRLTQEDQKKSPSKYLSLVEKEKKEQFQTHWLKIKKQWKDAQSKESLLKNEGVYRSARVAYKSAANEFITFDYRRTAAKRLEELCQQLQKLEEERKLLVEELRKAENSLEQLGKIDKKYRDRMEHVPALVIVKAKLESAQKTLDRGYFNGGRQTAAQVIQIYERAEAQLDKVKKVVEQEEKAAEEAKKIALEKEVLRKEEEKKKAEVLKKEQAKKAEELAKKKEEEKSKAPDIQPGKSFKRVEKFTNPESLRYWTWSHDLSLSSSGLRGGRHSKTTLSSRVELIGDFTIKVKASYGKARFRNTGNAYLYLCGHRFKINTSRAKAFSIDYTIKRTRNTLYVTRGKTKSKYEIPKDHLDKPARLSFYWRSRTSNVKSIEITAKEAVEWK